MVLAVGLLGPTTACRSTTDGAYQYRDRTPVDSTGTGRIYFGREIGSLKAHDGGVDWLERPSRETSEFPERLVQNLDLKPSDVVADIGAGTGYLTFRIAERVPHGRVLAVDIQPQMLAEIDARRDSLKMRNVQTVLGSVTDPGLPQGAVDVALLVASYHEFFHPWEMMLGILDGLRPGGRLVLIEYRGEDETLEVARLHRMTEEQARRELEAVGFRWRQTRDILPQQHFMIFEKPFLSQDVP